MTKLSSPSNQKSRSLIIDRTTFQGSKPDLIAMTIQGTVDALNTLLGTKVQVQVTNNDVQDSPFAVVATFVVTKEAE